ncbi:MAG: hypothetical protein E6J90_39610 [Deltaproteobacteria bacterium]|nr:MAG: hypothetical protein E6J90_39610 [Deltaproteobacteria bacterium]TMQ21974.1 MAG: hypothetical protein E6J91_01895 [Deltaproteobacteria bacterium]
MPGHHPSIVLAAACAVAVGLTAPGCGHSKPARNLDLDQIRISSDARLRTDTVGDGKFASTASFVLVDAENAAAEGAYVTLGGELADAAGARVGDLRSQSLWIPPHEVRTFALVDRERVARPAAAGARIKIYGAVIPDEPPRAQITDLHSFDDRGKIVVQAYLVNAADRPGQIMVLGSFHDAHGQPMTRPFQMVEIAARDRRVVQFVGPEGSTRGTIFVGDTIY